MRLMIVEDYRFIRRLMRDLIALMPGAEVIAEASSGDEALALARELRPDAVLMDLSLHGMNGMTATEIIRRELPAVRVLIVSHHTEAGYVRHALQAGACGYLPKSAMGTELLPALAAVERGETWFSPSLDAGEHERRAPAPAL